MLNKDLGGCDHGLIVVETLGDVDHDVARILLCARIGGGEKGTGGVYCDSVTLGSSVCSIAGVFPTLDTVDDGLSDSLVKQRHCGSRGDNQSERNENVGQLHRR